MPGSPPIPNINIGQVYDQRFADAEVHYDALGSMADFFGRNMPAHRHDRFFQVHYVMSGMVRVYLDERQFHQQAPMFFVTPPTVTHAFVTEPGSEGHVLTVRQQLVWALLEESGELGDIHEMAPLCVATGRLGGHHAAEVARLERLFDELRRESVETRPGRVLAMQTLTRLIVISLLRLSSHSLTSQPVRHEDLSLFQRFNLLVEEHYADHWTVPHYARGLGITESRLNDLCRRIAGLSSKRLVHDRLMQEARRLLTFTTVSVNEIGYQLGFNDPGYFCRFFARHARMTPSRYRRGKSAR